MLFHITTRKAWNVALDAGAYVPSLFAADGFIHLSEERQWFRTARRLYRGQRDLVLLVIDEKRLEAGVRREAADGELFPHLYGPLNLDAVISVYDLPLDANGDVLAPATLDIGP
ncbi:MAG TPA: DUF952 domain-containing protein [Polyangiales bacterium]|nr:DUF952 domain-containing protein [Polyangiales bacterium]